MFAMDHAIVDEDTNIISPSSLSSTVSSPGASNTLNPAIPPSIDPSSAPKHSSGLSEARLIALTAGIAVFITVLLIALGYLICGRRRRNRRRLDFQRMSPATESPRSCRYSGFTRTRWQHPNTTFRTQVHKLLVFTIISDGRTRRISDGWVIWQGQSRVVRSRHFGRGDQR
ncbi:hypothetical protein B0H12DRAFT_1116122 [Mycena haematopus]|nr:hypothetical protein B0H12DRAFT_1116122 [Mycena haematopus]